jgi:hypothetical protein
MTVSADHMHSRVTASSATVGSAPELAQAAELIFAGRELPPLQLRVAPTSEVEQVRKKLWTLHDQLFTYYVRRADKKATPREKVFSVLKDASISRQSTGFGNHAMMEKAWTTVDELLDRDQPISMALLFGGTKTGNPLKVGWTWMPDLSEWASHIHLNAIGRAIEEVYRPGARVYPIYDSGLHTGDLGADWIESHAHQRQLGQDLKWLGITHSVPVDPVPLLPSDWGIEVRNNAMQARQVFARDTEGKMAAQAKALMYSINTRVELPSLEDAALVYYAATHEDPRLPREVCEQAMHLIDRSNRVCWHYTGTNWAIRTRDLAGTVVKDQTGDRRHLRLSIHAKPGEPRPFMLQSNSLTRAALVPMHGLGQVEGLNSEGTRFGNLFYIEGRMRGMVQVVDEKQRHLWFEQDPGMEQVIAQ